MHTRRGREWRRTPNKRPGCTRSVECLQTRSYPRLATPLRPTSHTSHFFAPPHSTLIFFYYTPTRPTLAPLYSTPPRPTPPHQSAIKKGAGVEAQYGLAEIYCDAKDYRNGFKWLEVSRGLGWIDLTKVG